MAASEARIREVGEDLFRRMKGQTPGLFDKAWWSGQVLEWAMRDDGFKTEMFRFVDVFPVLTTPEEIARHIQEYLLRPGINAPAVIKVALKGAGLGRLATKVAAGQIAKNLEGMARNFIAGADASSALSALATLRAQGQAFTVDLLGEATVSESEADAYAAKYAALIEDLAAQTAGWASDPRLDSDDRGPIPRVNVSVKVSAMYSQLDATAFEASLEPAAERLVPLFLAAKRHGAFLNLDMEQYALKDLTLALFKRVLEDPRLDGFEDAGVVIQAYLRDAEKDLRELVKWAKKKKRRVTVRLVKGAYWDVETVQAETEGWPAPVWLDKADSDVCFETCADLMLGNHKHLRSAIGSHNVRSLAHSIASAERYKVPADGYEIQALYGMAEPIKGACVERGHRVRVYAPIGELIPGMGYLVRRLLENTSNEGWLRAGFADGRSMDELLATPRSVGRGPMLRAVPPALTPADDPPAYVNEPLRDFGDRAQREAFGNAVAKATKTLGRTYAPLLGGRPVAGGRVLDSVDPADGETLVGAVHLATVADADRAIAHARDAFSDWRDRPVRDRAAAIFGLAAKMRRERDALSALMVREVGKPWREADAGVAEAIDFCEYYAREALRLAEPRLMQRLPGELNHLSYQARGVAAVISPWNFPLAICTGMTAAALVTGNTVVVKPAEQSMVIAERMVRLAHEAGVPTDALSFLPGVGEEVGAHLVAHPDVATIAFTGSRAVGLAIYREAGITHPGQVSVKRVVCEMGGKNAIVVDNDADLDEAVLGVVRSAFGYAGQKCSACSRAIVVTDHYENFVERVAEATRSLRVGAPTDPATKVGPVIDAEAHARIAQTIRMGRTTARLVVGGGTRGPGYYVEPTVFADVDPADPLATDEIFGPVLAITRADDFDHGIDLALRSEYALTGGVYSRSPANIAKARARFRVGNLYINRSITGAIVGRQPFGGFHMSGGGTKAGGPDYLLNFLDPRVITENTQRRGFVPES